MEILAARLAAKPITATLMLSAGRAGCFLDDEATEVAVAAADWAMLNGRFFRWKRRQGHTPNEQGVCRDNQEGDGFFHELYCRASRFVEMRSFP